MATQFGSYSPSVPLNTSWQETITLVQDDGVTPVDLTGYEVHAQLRPLIPLAASGVPTTDPVIEITTAAFYSPLPAWPIVEGFTVPTPTNGTIVMNLHPDDFSLIVSPTNAKVKLYWEIKLVNTASDYVQPVVSGKVGFMPAVTF